MTRLNTFAIANRYITELAEYLEPICEQAILTGQYGVRLTFYANQSFSAEVCTEVPYGHIEEVRSEMKCHCTEIEELREEVARLQDELRKERGEPACPYHLDGQHRFSDMDRIGVRMCTCGTVRGMTR